MNVKNEVRADRPPVPVTVRAITFGLDGNCRECVADGWSGPEQGFRWMIGGASELKIDLGLAGGHGVAGGDYLIELDLIPFVKPPAIPFQRLTVAVNDTVVGASTVDHAGRFGYRVSAAALAGRDAARVVLTHPDAARPCDVGQNEDGRLLSLAVKWLRVRRMVPHTPGAPGLRLDGSGGIAPAALEPLLGLAPDRFMLKFESLGDNCEFGLVQRRCGAEPVSLLRFSSTGLPTLLHGLEVGFRDFGAPENIDIRLEGGAPQEYMVHETRYGLVYHTYRYEGQVDDARLRANEPKGLAFRLRKFLADLRDGEKIFVCKRNAPFAEEEILPLYDALSIYGPIMLLWMVPADPAHPSGTVEVVFPGLFKGYIERFAPYNDAHDLLLNDWVEVCANAYRLSLRGRPSLMPRAAPPPPAAAPRAAPETTRREPR